MKLPPEIRRQIYGHLLRNGVHWQHTGDVFDCGDTEDRFQCRLSDSDYSAATRDRAEARFAVHVEDEPSNRNLDATQPLRSRPRRVNIMELYEAIQNAPPDSRPQVEPPGYANSEARSQFLETIDLDRLDEESPSTSDSESDTDDEEPNAPAYIRRTYAIELALPARLLPGCKSTGGHDTVPAWDEQGLLYWKGRAKRKGCSCLGLMRDEYDWIRLLGQVSRHFTYELGSFLWTSATLHVDEPEVFLDFFVDRPALVPLVRRIVLHTRCYGDAFDTLTTTLREICEFVSANMEISSFVVCLDTVLGVEERGPGDMFATTREEAKALICGPWADIFRDLRVDVSFKLLLQREPVVGYSLIFTEEKTAVGISELLEALELQRPTQERQEALDG